MRLYVLAAAMFALSGCGGGGGSSSGGGSTPTPPPATNAAPVVSQTNTNQNAQTGVSFTYDATQSGATFSDPDGDTLTTSISLSAPANGLSADTTTVSGTPSASGTVTVTITATDPDGLSVADSFDIFISDPSSGNLNILLLVADDMGQDSSAQYSLTSDAPDTPNLDGLASNGLVFENLWVNPICSPTRATLMSGKYAVRTGVVEAGDALPASETVLQAFLANTAVTSIYESALIGKWHLGGGASGPNDAGIEHFAGIINGAVSDYYDWSLNVNGTASQVTTYATTELTDQAIDWVNQQSNPWFMTVSYNAPHTPFHLPPATLHNRTLVGTQTDIDNNPRPYYLASIEAMDAEVGRLLGALDPTVRSNTVILFIGDNGTPGRVRDTSVFPNDAKGSVYEGGVRVPMIVSGAGVTRVGEREDALLNGVDFFATIAELAGQTLPSIHASESFISLFTSTGPGTRDYIYSELVNQTAIRDDQYKLINNPNGSQELYDLNIDPTESTNLIGSGAAISGPLADLEAAMNSIVSGGDWIVNSGGEQSAYIMDGGAFVEVNVQSVTTNATRTTVTTNSIPNYRIEMTDELLQVYENKDASDFVSGSGILSLGDIIDWGQDVGYTGTCGTLGGDGFWPQAGGACAASQNGSTLSIPADPQPTSVECETGLGPAGIWVNGVTVYNWSDATSYNNDDVWNQFAYPFRSANMDMCFGHGAGGNTQYHHHSYSPCLSQYVDDEGVLHSPIYGYAGDGYPIHGPYHANGELTETCWTVRDYSSGSATGCGAADERTCTFVDEENISLGTQSATAGPDTDELIAFPGAGNLAAVPGIYYEDYYYDAACTAQGDKYLDEHNGHDHGSFGYHYHTTVDTNMEPVFPGVHGPDYYGEVADGSFNCFGQTF